MEDLERTQARLDNIRSVQPILGALRTISLGSWQAAQKQQKAAQQYTAHLGAMLPWLLAHLPADQPARSENIPQPIRVVALVIGSERGLCGRFNTAVAERAGQYLAEQASAGRQVVLAALGSRLMRLFQSQQHGLTWSASLPKPGRASVRRAFDLTGGWLARYETGELDAVDLLYNAYQGVGRYQPTVSRLIPPPLPARITLLPARPGLRQL